MLRNFLKSGKKIALVCLLFLTLATESKAQALLIDDIYTDIFFAQTANFLDKNTYFQIIPNKPNTYYTTPENFLYTIRVDTYELPNKLQGFRVLIINPANKTMTAIDSGEVQENNFDWKKYEI